MPLLWLLSVVQRRRGLQGPAASYAPHCNCHYYVIYFLIDSMACSTSSDWRPPASEAEPSRYSVASCTRLTFSCSSTSRLPYLWDKTGHSTVGA